CEVVTLSNYEETDGSSRFSSKASTDIAVTTCAVGRDVASVGSLRREVRAPAPIGFATEVEDLLFAGTSPKKSEDTKKHSKNASGKSDEGGYYKAYGSDAEGEKGYVKQTYSKGDNGYKTLDTFHKQDGDNYGFEKHTAFGKAQGGENKGSHGHSGSYKNHDGDDDHEGAGTIVESHYVSPHGGDAGHYSGEGEGEHYSSGGEGEHYTSGGEGEHYTSGGDGGHHVSSGDSGDGEYSNAGGHNEQYSTGGGEEGAYGSHGSYSSDGDGSHY
ncbi:cold and drought-regulated protein CORA, partial [Cephus cinctus]|uniref:Cold and drought-regulated protein CORA n=1 Tax=Cephus cinctus TaxID=211228 RepID=A0AAJ7RUU4_CEPCN